MQNPGKALRERLARPDILVLPGVYDALSAKVAVQAGFDGLVMGGYAIAASRLGEPDVGYLSMTEMAEALRTRCAGSCGWRHWLRQCFKRTAYPAGIRTRRGSRRSV